LLLLAFFLCNAYHAILDAMIALRKRVVFFFHWKPIKVSKNEIAEFVGK
jgi:hypothetical protein